MKNPFEHYASGENLYTRVVAPVCEKYGLTYMELTVLMFLANHSQYDTATQIVSLRRLTKSHVSISVRSLQTQGLLTGEYRDGDRRAVHLSLTDAACPIIRDGRRAQETFRKILFAGFTREEENILQQFMARIDRNIDDHAAQIFTV